MPTRRRLLQLFAAGAMGAAGVATAPVTALASTTRHRLLFFNHAYGVLDRETADAIERSTYLREFANFEVRTTTGSDGYTWTGRYLMGRQTYLELFGVGDLPDPDGVFGAGGLGVSTERDGDLDIVTTRLRDAGVEPVEFTQTRDFGDGEPVPWFDAVFTAGEYDAFGAWGMEFRPEYFADPRAEKDEPPSYPGDVGRERYLPDAYRDHLMRDVTSFRIGVTERDLSNTVPLLRAGGLAVRETPTGATAYDGLTAVRFDAVPLSDIGLRSITMRLNEPLRDCHRERIGQSTLAVGPGPSAEWTFTGKSERGTTPAKAQPARWPMRNTLR